MWLSSKTDQLCVRGPFEEEVERGNLAGEVRLEEVLGAQGGGQEGGEGGTDGGEEERQPHLHLSTHSHLRHTRWQNQLTACDFVS